MELTWFDEIPNVKLPNLERIGHEMHADDWQTIIHAISAHTS
ncbi:hypothetical protein [Domibacillus indicus]